jgi:hypothetical protein
MPSSVSGLLNSLGLTLSGTVPWGTRPDLAQPGLYFVTNSSDPSERAPGDHCPLSEEALDDLLGCRPELTVHEARPDHAALAAAISAMWPDGETVLYIGLAGTSVAQRVGAYYRTPIGARAPHAGGWPLKMLTILHDLHVHYAVTPEPAVAEQAALHAFMQGVPDAVKSTLSDPALPLPFANLELPSGARKQHGIRGARAPRARNTARVSPAPASLVAVPGTPVSPGGHMTYPLNVTEADLAAGHIRVTAEPKRALALPRVKTRVSLRLRDEPLTVAWDPRITPDKERSGLLRIGKTELRRLVGTAPTALRIGKDQNGLLDLR